MTADATERFTLRVEMLSDWHVGAGYGRPGDVDRLVRRDADDLPYVPAKTLTGVWRDGCELAADALDHGLDDRPWKAWLDALFGNQVTEGDEPRRMPIPAVLGVRSARLPEEVRDLLRSREPVRKALTFVKPGVRLDGRSGAAKDDFLRFEEMTRGGMELEATGQLSMDADDQQRRAAEALLVAGAALVWRLGAKRRRGAGRCRLTLDGWMTAEQAAEWLDANPLPPEPATPTVHTTVRLDAAEATPATTDRESWSRLTLTLTTLTPVIVLDEVLGNIMTSRDYLPGRYLLTLVTRALRQHGVNAAPLVAANQLVCTDATVVVGTGRGAPLPLAFHHDKLQPDALCNRLVEQAPPGPALRTSTDRWVSPAASSGPLTQAVVARQRTTHNAVEDKVQRPTADVGGVYTNEAIPAEVTLAAEVRMPKAVADALPPGWWKSLAGEQSFGRSRKDDYGLCSVEVGDGFEALPTARREAEPGALRVWALSDIVLLDERLRAAPTIRQLASALSEALGVEVTPREEGDDGALLASAHLVRRTDSWQASWGLPRPTVLGLRAGSCAVFDIAAVPDQASLEAVEASGIGERRAEGYGQVLLDPPLLARKLNGADGRRITLPRPREEIADPANGHAEVPEWLEVAERAAWRAAIAEGAARVAADDDARRNVLGVAIKHGEGKPPTSQLGGLRGAVSRLRSFEDSPRAVEWVDRLLANKRRAEKWPDRALEDHVRPLLDNESRVWELLELPEDDLTLPVNSQQRKEALREALWAEAVRGLVSAVLHAHQRDLEQASRQGQAAADAREGV